MLELECQSERINKAIERKGAPLAPKPKSLNVKAPDFLEKAEARDGVWLEHENKRMEFSEALDFAEDLQLRLYIARRDAIDAKRDLRDAREALDAELAEAVAEARREAEVHTLRAEVIRMKLEKQARAEWNATAEAAWGPDHVSRPPKAYYDMRG